MLGNDSRGQTAMRLAVVAVAILMTGCQGPGPAPPGTDGPESPPGAGVSQLSVLEVAAIANAAGFACSETLLSAVAIAVAESALYPDAVLPRPDLGIRPDGSEHMDRGLWQISSYFWPEFSDAQVFDPRGAADAAFLISRQGTDFSPWDTTWRLGIPQRHFDASYNGWPALRPIIEDYCNGTAAVAQTDPAPATRAPLPTAHIIHEFLVRRASALADVGPTLDYYLGRFKREVQSDLVFASSPTNFFAIVAGEEEAAFDDFATGFGRNWALWAQGSLAQYRQGASGTQISGQVATFEAGIDYLVADRLIVGFMFSADAARELSYDLGYRVGGTGWMAGPYAAVQFGDSIVFDVKFVWGRSVNTIQPQLTYTDMFTTTRRLATARLAGEAVLGPVRFRPQLSFVYFSEIQSAYVDTNGGTIPRQTIGTARLDFGPEIAVPIATENGALLEPTIALQGIWDISAAQLSARLTGGLTFIGGNGLSLSLRGGLGGVFVPDLHSWNVQARVAIPLN